MNPSPMSPYTSAKFTPHASQRQSEAAFFALINARFRLRNAASRRYSSPSKVSSFVCLFFAAVAADSIRRTSLSCDGYPRRNEQHRLRPTTIGPDETQPKPCKICQRIAESQTGIRALQPPGRADVSTLMAARIRRPKTAETVRISVDVAGAKRQETGREPPVSLSRWRELKHEKGGNRRSVRLQADLSGPAEAGPYVRS